MLCSLCGAFVVSDCVRARRIDFTAAQVDEACATDCKCTDNGYLYCGCPEGFAEVLLDCGSLVKIDVEGAELEVLK
jgi:hypothetical protein